MIDIRRAVLRSIVAVLPAVFSAACSDAPAPPDYAELLLSQQVRIQDPARIGALAQISSAAVGPDRSLYVVEWVLRRVLVFDSTGAPVRTIGGPGTEPGSFALPGSIGFLGDSLWVADPELRRVSIFAPDGSLARVIAERTVEGETPPSNVPRQMSIAGLLPDGSRLYSSMSHTLAPGAQPGYSTPIMRSTQSGLDTLFRVPVPPSFGLQLGTRLDAFAAPFDDGALVSVSVDGGGWLEVNRSVAELGPGKVRVVRHTLVGEQLWTSDITLSARRIPGSAVDSAVRSAAVGAAQLEGLRAWVDPPTHYPAATAAILCADGSAWIREHDWDGRSRWIRIDASGIPDGQIHLAAETRILHAARDQFWALERDSLGIPALVRYAMR